VGFLPENITVGGDSAGGSIALAVVRYVVEKHLPQLLPPGGLIAASPAVDMSFSRADTNSSHYLNAASDTFDLPPNTHPFHVGKFSIRAYMGEVDPKAPTLGEMQDFSLGSPVLTS
jgi:acetyl esterase/lipase